MVFHIDHDFLGNFKTKTKSHWYEGGKYWQLTTEVTLPVGACCAHNAKGWPLQPVCLEGQFELISQFSSLLGLTR
ncbi:MAG: hypothetical protein GY927_07475 [bacterium]|nr:hypothetical protein [bacterium]